MENKKNEERDLTYFRELQYDCVLKKKGDHFITFIPELAIVAEGETFDAAYEKINVQKEAYFQEMIETSGLRITGLGENGEARIVELPSNHFFLATNFQPQLISEEGKPHPLIVAYLQGCICSEQ